MQLINSQTRLHQIIESLQAFIDGFGYERLETQLLQPADLFLTKAGDQLIQRLFTFEHMGTQLALRPEFTASAAKAYADQMNGGGARLPVRWQFDGAIFEDSPDSNNVFQRYSVGAELIGWDGLSADAEVIALSFGGLNAIGYPSANVILGSVQFMRSLLASYDLDARTLRFIMDHLAHLHTDGKAFILERFDKLASITGTATAVGSDAPMLLNSEATLAGRTREDILRRLQRKSQRAASRGSVVAVLDQLEQLHAVSDTLDNALRQIRALLLPHQTEAAAALEHLEALIAILGGYNIPAEQIRIQPTLARDWNYYTGIVFELRTPSGVLLAGGGRYDELVRLIGGGDVSAVGMAVYIDRLLRYAELSETIISVPVVIYTNDDAAQTAAWWASRLRAEGIAVSLLDAQSHDPVTNAIQFQAHADGTLQVGDSSFSQEQFSSVLSKTQTG